MRTLVIGDSYSSAIEADTGLDRGWPEILGIDPDCRQAVAGTTAVQWARDNFGRLTRAIRTPADVVILSLLGNDALQNIVTRPVSIQEIWTALGAMRQVVNSIRVDRKRVIVLLYADPFRGKRPEFAMGLGLLNGSIKLSCPYKTEFFDASFVLGDEHFNGTDIHPTRAGHEVIATGMAAMLGGPIP